MKTYNITCKRVFKRGLTKEVVPVSAKIEATTFKEARDIIRSRYTNAISIDISEVPDSFRENTPQETSEYIKKYGSRSKTIKEKALSNDQLIKDTILFTIQKRPDIKAAVTELVKYRPKKSLTMEDKIKEVLLDADICDYKEDFLVSFNYGHIEVLVVDDYEKLPSEGTVTGGLF